MMNKAIRKHRQPMDNRGFTLVEVMIGMAIFAIGFLAVSAMQITAIQGNGSAREGTEAATLAAAQAERLMAQPYASIVTGGPMTNGAYTLSWNVADDSPVNGTKTITIRVDWQDRGARNFSVNYIKADVI
jgi:type IV pilus assembly protein PilV